MLKLYFHDCFLISDDIGTNNSPRAVLSAPRSRGDAPTLRAPTEAEGKAAVNQTWAFFI